MDREKMREYGREHFGVGERAQARSILGDLDAAVSRRLEAFDQTDLAGALAARDGTPFAGDAEGQARAGRRLRFLDLPTNMRDEVPGIEDFVAGLSHDGIRHVVLLAAGGSARFAEVLVRVLRPDDHGLDLRVIDTSHPQEIRTRLSGIDLDATAVIVASKSGSTAETRALERHLATLRPAGVFAAITDPGTDLHRTATAGGWRRVFETPEDVGGRFGALTHFGLVPGAVLGIDVERLLDRARAMVHVCSAQEPAVHNPGLWLGAVLGEAARAGRDKLTFISSPDLAPFEDWLEQLVAESTGKAGSGIVPVVRERLGAPLSYGRDRLFVYLRHDGSHARDLDRKVRALENAGHPVVHLDLPDEYDLGAEVVRWSVAVAAAGVVLGVDAFDAAEIQPAEDRADALLQELTAAGSLPEPEPTVMEGNVSLWAEETIAEGDRPEDVLRVFLDGTGPTDAVSVLAYVPRVEDTRWVATDLRDTLRRAPYRTVTFAYGPRYLHATGRLHLGGPEGSLFLIVTHDPGEALPVPGEGWGFESLIRAQAVADVEALMEAGRRVVRVHVHDTSPVAALARVRTLVAAAMRHEPG